MAAATNNASGGGSSKVRVSQATIDKIKAMGMTKALAGAKSANPEMKEALTRMYGASRVAKAAGSATSTATTYKKNNMPAYRPATAGTTNSIAKKTATPASKPAAKKTGTTDPFAKAVFGAGKAVGAAFTPDWKKKEAAMKAAKNKSK